MLYSNPLIYIELHESQIPWVKIFTHIPHKEFSHCSTKEKVMILEALDCIEIVILEYFNPEKINIASFGNMLPRVHWHIMARFSNDDYFPEPMWGAKQREGFTLNKPIEPFLTLLSEKLITTFR
jgi:diadenosine tetraphosphate (Ap4A) HIT family hydrolase